MRAIRRSLLVWVLLLPAIAVAGGPRFVTGPPFFTGQSGQPIGWKQTNLLYYTDPGALSAAVDHQAADALVAAAAGVWNVPVASITVGEGGALAEHVNGQNVYLDTVGMVFPADVMSANAAAVPIAVIYDTDGSVTDLLLGSGASSPSGCRQNAVTQTVDSFDPAGYILHAIVVLNGRCTGAAPEMQLEMQYQLMRAFGRVLGLAWSQTNDNVFTGSPQPTYNQAANWPIMHPLEIICGPYSYQCLPSPFQLRADDIGSMVAVYPIGQNATPAAGKQISLSNASYVQGHLLFPAGEGMAGVNVLVKREVYGSSTFDSWFEASGVSGMGSRSGVRSPFVAPDTTAWGSFGTPDPNQLGAYSIAYVPIATGTVDKQNVTITTEPVNALYAGAYGLAPYAMGAVAPSGSPVSQEDYGDGPEVLTYFDFTVADAAPGCGNGADGTASSPMAAPTTGWWKGLLCGYGHASYVGTAVQPGRSFTIEVTALDAQGIATEAKAMPVIGLFAPTDAAGDLPSLGVAAGAFNSVDVGMTAIHGQTGQLTSFWFGIADERGDGRPDYSYQARLFYADNVSPAQVGTAGGTISIVGMGFRAGNVVTINGVAASVVSWTANTIVVTAPSMVKAGAANGTAVDITVSDLSTGASSAMTAAFTYTTVAALPNTMRLVSAQSATMYVGDAAQTSFAVQVLKADGVTPVVGDAVIFSAAAGTAQFAACGAATCTVRTDAKGMASTGVTPEAAGTVTMQAMDGALTQSASFTALAQTGSLVIWSAPSGNLPMGVVAQTPIGLNDLWPSSSGGGRNPGRAVTFTVLVGSAIFSGCNTSVCTVITNGSGQLTISVTPTAVGPVTIQAADGDVTATTSFVALSNVDVMTVAVAPAATNYIGTNPGQFGVNLFLADGVTRDTWEQVTFTGPPGVSFPNCGSNVCTVTTGWGGEAQVAVQATQTGVFTIQAAFGGVTQTVTFTMIPHTVQLSVVSIPTVPIAVGTVAATPFAVQLLQDGTTPISGVDIGIGGAQGEVSLLGCHWGVAVCRATTDNNGMVSMTVMPLVAGQIALSATYVPQTVTATFTAVGVGQTMTIVEQPPPTVFVGDPLEFIVQVLGPGGLLPMQGDNVEYAILSGPFGWSDWSATRVNRQADGNGEVFEYGSAWAAGPITVLVTDGTVSQTFNFTAVARPDVVQVISAPASGSVAGTAASTPFAVQVLMHDGVTPLAQRTVTISVTNGAGSLAACGGAASCQIVTDAQGMISTMVTPLSVGTITLSASEGGVQQSVSFTTVAPVAPPTLSVTALNPSTYIAAGATITLALNGAALYNGAPAANQAVVWTMSGGFATATTNTVTNSNGIVSDQALLGPMTSGSKVIATACAWGNVCAEFDGYGVDPAAEAIAVVSGGEQLVSGGAALVPVVVKAVDGAGHPVAAAAVSIYQTVTAYAGPCPASGRCPAAELLASQATEVVSGIDGTVTVVPLVVSGQPTQTEIAFSVGTQGFATVVETSGP